MICIHYYIYYESAFLHFKRFKNHFEELPKLLPTPSQTYSIVHNSFANKALFLLNTFNHGEFEKNCKLEGLLISWLTNALSLLPPKTIILEKHSSKTSFSNAFSYYPLLFPDTVHQSCIVTFPSVHIYKKYHKKIPNMIKSKKWIAEWEYKIILQGIVL